MTKEQSVYLEAHTREQSGSKLWFVHRAGRITASNFKAAAVTNSCMPSQSLISRLCYPENHKFSTAATRYRLKFSDIVVYQLFIDGVVSMNRMQNQLTVR